MSTIYDWLLQCIETEYNTERTLRESDRSRVRIIRHRASGRRFLLRQFRGSTEVYRKLLHCECRYIPSIFAVEEKGPESLVLEEFVEGDSLDFLLRGSLFSARETRRIVNQICQGLWILHSMGAVHRDIKPENVILRGDAAVLVDFDAARLHKPGNENDTCVLGTAGFAAPEQYGLTQCDARADIYALGILINVMRTGLHPAQRLTPGRLGAVVQRCTQINPEKRYASVLRLMEAL